MNKGSDSPSGTETGIDSDGGIDIGPDGGLTPDGSGIAETAPDADAGGDTAADTDSAAAMLGDGMFAADDGENTVTDARESAVGEFARLEEELFLSLETEAVGEIETTDRAAVGQLLLDVSEIHSGMSDLGRGITSLLADYSLLDRGMGETLQPALTRLATAWQRDISFAERIAALAGETVREWISTPGEQRDAQLEERMTTFSESLSRVNADVAAALSGVNAASELLARAGENGGGDVDAETLLARVEDFTNSAFEQVSAEMRRRDSVFFDLELLRLRRGEVTAIEGEP